MRIVFIGVVEIGRRCLETLLGNGANIVGVFTADKKAMTKLSGMDSSHFAEFGSLCEERNIPLHKVTTVRDPIDTDRLKSLNPDIIYCIGWPKIISKEILSIPPRGCLGIHPTLLPERRGGAPTNWCLIDGVEKSGVTLFYLTEGLDNGDIVAQQELMITLEDTACTLREKIMEVAAKLVGSTYQSLSQGLVRGIPQDESRATYTRRRKPEDGIIDWNQTSLAIYNFIRALGKPYPGAFTYRGGRKVIIWEAALIHGYKCSPSSMPSEPVEWPTDSEFIVQTGDRDNCILIKKLEVVK